MIRVILLISVLSLSACSLYQSPGSEAIQKGTIELVTTSGTNFSPHVRYECSVLVALPVNWQEDVTSLNEYSTMPDTNSVLLSESELPVVVVYSWFDRHVEGCAIELLDSKVSSKNLRDVVAFGEHLLIHSSRR